MRIYLNGETKSTGTNFTIAVTLTCVYEEDNGNVVAVIGLPGHITGLHVSPEDLRIKDEHGLQPFDPRAVPAGYWR